MAEYQFKRVSPELFKDIQYLYKHIFNQDSPISFFEQKFNTAAFGLSNTGYIAYAEDGSPAAYYGVFPCMVKLGDAEYLAAQSGDTMTHPDHRGQGLFISLAEKTYQLAKENDVKFIFGFPNENSYPGFVRKLNWQHSENLKRYTIKVSAIPLAALAKKIRFVRPFYNLYTKLILAFFKVKNRQFPSSVINNQVGGLIHNNAFFDYKNYLENYVVKCGAAKTWIEIDSDLKIGDIEITGQNITSVISKIKFLAFLLGCHKIAFTLSPGCYWDNALSSLYNYSEGLPIGYLDLGSGLDITKFKYVGADFDTF